MNTKKDDGQEHNQHSSEESEPIEPTIVPYESGLKEGASFDQFLEDYPSLIGQAIMLMLQQDSQNLRLTINQVQSLFVEAKETTEEEIEILAMQFMTNTIAFFEPLLRSMRFLNQGRFETAADELKKLKESCYSQVEKLNAIYDSADQEKKDILQYITLYLRLFGGWMAGYESQCSAEIVGYQGRTREYVGKLKETVKVLREAAAMVPGGSPPDLVQLSYLCSNNADQLEARAEAFEKLVVTKQYVETTGQKVFIVHGHDEARWRELRDLLEDEFNLSVVVLKEEAGTTRTIIEKFEHYAMDSCLAFAILTPDDFVDKEEAQYLQARPNVLFEIGWFYGRFGPAHVCILKKVGTEIPSDLAGISTIEFGENITEQSLAIRKELREVGLVP